MIRITDVYLANGEIVLMLATGIVYVTVDRDSLMTIATGGPAVITHRGVDYYATGQSAAALMTIAWQLLMA